MRSSIPSSAQWMSSIAITTGQRRLAASTSERTAEKRRSRICCGSSASCTPVVPLGGLVGVELVTAPLDSVEQLGPRQLRVVGVDDLELAADDLAERPVRQPGAIGRAVPDPEGGLLLAVRELRGELPQQSRLSDPCLADHRDQVRAPFAHDAVEERNEE